MKGQTAEVSGTGVVIEGKKVLTNAHLVKYATEIHVQARPGADKIEAKVAGVGSDVDLAVLSLKEEEFFQKKPALARAKLPRVQDSVTVYGFPVGGNDLSVTKGVVSRIDHFSFTGLGTCAFIQVSAAVNSGNSGGPAVVDNKMVGIVFSRMSEAEGIGYVIPNTEIDGFLERIRDGRYQPKPVDASGIEFQRLENAALRRMLKLDKKTQGILAMPPAQRDAEHPFKEFDIVTRIGSHPVNNEGMVRLPDESLVPFYALIPKLARDNAVPVTVVRGGRELALALPVTNRDKRLIRDLEGNKPTFFVHGPLVFSPVMAEAVSIYARLNPDLYGANSPMITRRYDRVQFPGEELVVVTSPMFAHKISKGYGDPVGKVVKDVNGVKIKNMRHLVETLRDCKDEYLRFRFAEDGSEILVFDRAEMNAATEEIMEENSIAHTRRGSPDMLRTWNKGKTPAP